MSQRAAELAAKLESANESVIAALEACTDEQLSKKCEEGWTPACTGHHVAISHTGIGMLASAIANGQPVPPVTMEMIDAGNAEHAEKFANVSREETLALLRSAGKETADMVRGLTDEQLDRTAPMAFAGGEEWSAAKVIELVLIGHPIQHGASIKAVTAS